MLYIIVIFNYTITMYILFLGAFFLVFLFDCKNGSIWNYCILVLLILLYLTSINCTLSSLQLLLYVMKSLEIQKKNIFNLFYMFSFILGQCLVWAKLKTSLSLQTYFIDCINYFELSNSTFNIEIITLYFKHFATHKVINQFYKIAFPKTLKGG